MKYKKVTWMVFYRTKSGKLSSMEVEGSLTKQEAIDKVMEERKISSVYPQNKDCLEWSASGPIVKRMCYV